MPGAVNEAIERYREEGYAIVRGFFAPDEVREMAAAFDLHWSVGMSHRASWRHGNLFYRLGEDAALGKVLKMVQWPAYEDAVLERIRRDPRWLPLLKPLLGGDIKQIINQMHWKPPGAAAAEFAFHQDVKSRRPRSAYRNLPDSYVQTGIAIDPHRAANGAMRILPGSHRLGEVQLGDMGHSLGQALADDALTAAGLDPSKVIDLELDPGDVALWNVFTVHGSGRNTTQGDRRFYLNGYVRAADCDRGEYTFRNSEPVVLGDPVLVHYEDLHRRPEPHFIDD
ncbi:phytanoyl-CoA dioxygenase family protein [Terricaulis silvestris]|uniref:Ectoine hydroxylase n=1 Tax=Terricaulis silvestris TaxID=2686094 RepID=A0A6I6MHU7_9CAUL|nr:phytanoyl-CoA dioxygenase family protein [Terricaulis silvestris]QGZ94545.1 ectoine hydroxylase [Terricaulis silvestris]